MLILDTEGRVVAHNTVDGSGRPINVANLAGRSFASEPWFTAVATGRVGRGEAFFAQPERSALVREATGGEGLSMVFAAPVFDTEGQLVRVWVNFASWEATAGHLFEGTIEALGRYGLTNVDAEIIGPSGIVLSSTVEHEVLNDDLGDNFEAASAAVSGETGYLLETDPDTQALQIVAFAGPDDSGFGFAAVVRQDYDKAMVAAASIRVLVIYLAVGAAVLILIGSVLFARRLTAPLIQSVGALQRVAAGQEVKRIDAQLRGEYGDLVDSINMLVKVSDDIAGLVEQVAAGDLTVQVKARSAEDALLNGLGKMVTDLRRALGKVQRAADEIVRTSSAVSDSSQVVSDNAQHAAASLEEMSAAMEELTAQTRQNASSAQAALSEAEASRSAAARGDNHVRAMVSAMEELDQSGKDISSIIRVIDDIAFQTNLLALNAAVEAARAGSHGRGFAVVAEEVRSLAERSAEAAKKTTGLINRSIESTTKGRSMASEMASSFDRVLEGVGSLAGLISEIAGASDEQANAIAEVSQSLQQLDQLTQRNTASAEEMAASAIELRSQSAGLHQLTRRFRLSAGDVEVGDADSDGDGASQQSGTWLAPPRVRSLGGRGPGANDGDYEGGGRLDFGVRQLGRY